MTSGPELPSGTVTFLFTDIEGSTRLLKEVGRDQYEGLLAAHAEIVRSALPAYNGQIVDTKGDSFFVAFRAARDALVAAAELQRAFAAHEWPGGARVRVRMGLHSGEPKVGGEGYVGIGVHRAARIGAVAHGGQVLLSSATRELVEDDLPDGISVLDLGAYRLKDIDRPERVSQLAAVGLPTEFPPLRGAEPVEHKRRPHPSGLRRRSFWVAILAGVIAAAVAIPVFAFGRGSAKSVASADSLVRIDPTLATVTAGVEVSGQPSAVTTCVGSVFVASRDGTVFEIDPRTSKPFPIFIGASAGDISHIGGLAVAVRQTAPKNTVTVIDASYGGISDVVALPGPASAPARVTVYGQDIWIANPNRHELDRIESPYTGVADAITLPSLARSGQGDGGYAGVAAGEGALWVAGNDANRTLWRVDPATRRVTPVKLPFAPRALVAGYGSVWVVDREAGAVVRLDPATGRLGRRISVGRGPSSIALGAGFVWVANELSGTVSRIDPRGFAVKTTRVGSNPIDVAVGLGAVWVVRRTS